MEELFNLGMNKITLEVDAEYYQKLVMCAIKYAQLIKGLLSHARLLSGTKDKMYIVSAEEVLAIVDPIEYQKRLEELVEEADG